MRDKLRKLKTSWLEVENMSGTDYEIQRWIQKLDTVACEYECRWGVSRLHSLVPYELAKKWKAHEEKLNAAICDKNLYDLPELVEGAIRGYSALEAAAIAQGHKPHDAPLAWTVGMPSGKTLAIVRHSKDAALMNDLKRDHVDVVVWTVDEIARVIDGSFELSNIQRKTETLKPSEFDFTKGDDLPF